MYNIYVNPNNTTLNEVLKEMIDTIQNNYTNFIARLDAEGFLPFYEKQSDFAKKLMFYNECGDTKSCRNVLKQYFLNYDYSAEAKCSATYVEKMKEAGIDIEWLVERVNQVKNDLLASNPILCDTTVPEKMRKNLISAYVRNSPDYKSLEEHFVITYKDLAASCVNKVMGIGIENRRTKDLLKNL